MKTKKNPKNTKGNNAKSDVSKSFSPTSHQWELIEKEFRKWWSNGDKLIFTPHKRHARTLIETFNWFKDMVGENVC